MDVSSGDPSSGGGHEGGPGDLAAEDHGHFSPELMAYFARRQVEIERLMRYFAAGICGLIAIFVISHWVRWLCVKPGRSNSAAGLVFRPFAVSSRLVRNLLVRKVSGFTSAGHAVLITAYVGINVAVTFTNVNVNTVGSLGHRTGWVTLANLVLVIFLALKNTPLAFLTAYSYERLVGLHQVAGCTMFILMVIHAATYTAYFNSQGELLHVYAEPGQVAGIVAGFGFLGVIFSALVLRRFWYELFYVMHISCWAIGIVAVGFHQPEFGHKILIVTLIAASLWLLDRLIRACKIAYYSANNEVTLHPLPDGGTKIVMKKAPVRAKPGKHCFIWIPKIRKLETHPFTIHRSSPVEFTVKACNGFTSDLHKYAVAHPGAALRASVDGPYGTFPDPMEFDKIVLIAGGGGATFTFGLAVNVLERMDENHPKNVVFIWAVRKHENLSWFSEQLDTLRTHAHSPNVNVSLYVTRAPSSTSEPSSGSDDHAARFDSSSEGADSPPLSRSVSNPEGIVPRTPASALRWSSPNRDLGKEIEEKDVTTTITDSFQHAIKAGRPDTASLIRDAVNTTPRTQRVLVAACGPDGLMRVVRGTTAKLILSDGPAVELHCEEFGW